MKLKPLIMVMLCLGISGQMKAQDLIYKKDGKKIEAIVLKKSGQSRYYKLFNQSDGTTYYINSSVLDSIIYQNGEKENFRFSTSPYELPVQSQMLYCNHFQVGTDLLGLAYGNPSFSFEYLPDKSTVGLKGIFALFNTSQRYLYEWEGGNEEEYYYHNFNDDLSWHIMLGVNLYFFPPRTFRFCTGLHYLFGEYTVLNSYYNDSINTYNNIKISKGLHGIVLGLGAYYHINRSLAVNFNGYLPLFLEPSFRRMVLSSEILYKF